METIYVKRFTKQDITKSYSPSTDATRDFFGVDLNMTQEYVNIDVCYYGNQNCPPDITIHKGYQGEKDWRICGDNFKPLYAFRNPEEGDLSVWKRYGRNGAYKFTIQVVKKSDPEYSDYEKFLSANDNHLYLALDENLNEKSVSENIGFIKNFEQIIYYGVPGSGKSFTIDGKINAISEEQKLRVVFHPEYTNSDFVGQILPQQTSKGINYVFKPGPFTRILTRAIKNPDKPYYLIIEEINRGNASAIFGDLFQLLDRDDDGWSKYAIDNTDIIYEIIKDENGEPKPFFLFCGEKAIHFDYNAGIRLPPNLSILATMNTSDQNVFTLDNAFQRRWDMQLVKNECSDENQMDALITIKNQTITWKNFQTQINNVIGEKSNESGLSSMEDKRLGCWFVKAINKTISPDTFANKVLKYLWDDAFKFYHNEVFIADIKNFEELQKKFFEIGFDIFNDVCELKEMIKTSDENQNA